MSVLIFWDVTPRGLVGIYQCLYVCMFKAEVSPEDGDSIFLRNVSIYL
jgi:hypothetical protein